MKALARKFDTFLEHVLDEHIENRRKKKAAAEEEGVADKDDMVDVLLQLTKDPNLKVQLKRS
ncbi:hypothetical protein QJS10_CPB19g01906 [Acorus calamus]|uniref:Uncharacterized protein n=1 Tax=Acorus calamus TaxID=4465 RepID=A0AAV9CDK9_ACOCL|nr:hypothetical protein QJS10_CPB19g01906 [Acorus calamus]